MIDDPAIPHFTHWCDQTGAELRSQGHDVDDTGLLSLYLKTFPGRTAPLIEELLDYRNKHLLAVDVDKHVNEHKRALEREKFGPEYEPGLGTFDK